MKTLCPECGPNVVVDEDGLCVSCGSNAVGPGIDKALAAERERCEELEAALEESVKLQSHYAKLLNLYDDGERITFKSAADWMERLSSIREGEK